MTHRAQKPPSTGFPDATTASTKFRIEQPVLGKCVKKGPYAVERSIDPNEVVIKRRFGEGSKPIFERDDINVNRSRTKSPPDSGKRTNLKNSLRGRSRHSSSDSSNSDYYRNRSREYHPPPRPRPLINPNLPKLENLTPLKRLPPEKLPYFADEKREKERIAERYGSTKYYKSFKRSQHTSSKSTSNRHKRSYSRSRSRSPKNDHKSRRSPKNDYKSRRSPKDDYKSRRSPLKDYTSHRSTTLPRAKSIRRSSRSKSVERHHRHSSSRSRYHRSYSQIGSRSRTLRSRSRTRSRSHERKKRTEERSITVNPPVPAPTTQIITIPVPVPDPYRFPTGYSSWPHIPSWPPAAQGPTRFSTPYAMPHAIPHFMDPSLYSTSFRGPPPSSYRIPYNPYPFRPRLGLRSMRGGGNYRP